MSAELGQSSPIASPIVSAPRPSLRRVLGIPDGVALFVGISVGVGIYATPQIIAGYVGYFPLVLFLWLAVGLFILVGCLIYAELGTRLPETGGEYIYLSRSLSPFVGFMFGWAQLFIIRTGSTAGVALVAADYLGYFVRLSAFGRLSTAFLILACLGAINWFGVKRSSSFQKASTALKIVGISALIVSGFLLVRGQGNDTWGMTGAVEAGIPPGNIIRAVMMIFFAYGGWARVGYVAGEMRDPRRVIPMSLFIGIGTVIAVNCLMNVLYFRTLGMKGIAASTILASDTAMRILGPAGAGLVAALVVVSALGTMNGTIMSASRCYYAMAHDGLLFRRLDYVHPKFLTPANAILAHCLWAGALILIRRQFEAIVAGRVFAGLIFYALATVSLFRLRKSKTGEVRAYRMPLYPWLPALFLAGLLGFIILRVALEWRSSMIDLAFVFSGLPYWVYRKSPSRARRAPTSA